jgi:hypothetical protein
VRFPVWGEGVVGKGHQHVELERVCSLEMDAARRKCRQAEEDRSLHLERQAVEDRRHCSGRLERSQSFASV